MKFEIRDENITYNRVQNPAAVFDRETGTLHRIGEREAMLTYFNIASEAFRENELHHEADNLIYMELPRDQQEIDRVFQITGYIKKLYEKTFAHVS